MVQGADLTSTADSSVADDDANLMVPALWPLEQIESCDDDFGLEREVKPIARLHRRQDKTAVKPKRPPSAMVPKKIFENCEEESETETRHFPQVESVGFFESKIGVR